MENGHFSIEEIEQFIQQKGPAESQSHLATCQECKSLLEDCQAVSTKLEKLASVHIGAGNVMNCPDERIWFDVAAGTLPESESLQIVQHAAECNSCGQKLKAATRMFEEELSPEEEQVLGALPGAEVKAQRKLGERLADTAKARRVNARIRQDGFHQISFWKPLSFSLAGAAVVVSAVLVFVSVRHHDSPADVEKLLANGYTEDRRVQMRPVRSHYGEWRQQRGSDDESLVNLPDSLRKATDTIVSGLRRDPTNPKWLVLQAQLDLLGGHYRAALDALSKVPPSAVQHEYHMALGNALLQKAEAESNKDYYLQAIEQFSVALNDEPHDSLILFDRALAYDRLNLLENALQDWQSAFTYEADSGWRREVSQYLAEDNFKLDKQQNLNELTNPQQMNSASELRIDAYAEQLQELATSSWLPAIAKGANADFTKAVFKLASILERWHSDPWLTGILTRASHSSPAAFIALANAIHANVSGHHGEALKQARQAARLFNRNHNQPGELRARFEEVYALHRSLQGSRCLSGARRLARRLSLTRYRWLQAQTAMEEAICENYAGDLRNARDDLSFSRRLAERSHFPILLLRNFGLTAGIDRQQGLFRDVWNEIQKGLQLYWAGDYPAARLYQFYMVLGLYAEQKSLWEVAESVERMAVRATENEPDNIQRGTARLQLVNVLVAEKKDDLAAAEMSKADAILNVVKTDPLTNTYRLTSKIELADLQVRQGSALVALETLKSARNLLSETQGYFIYFNFHKVRGDTYFALNQLEEAASDYLVAVSNSESSLRILKDETSRRRWLKVRDSCYRGLVRVALKEGDNQTALRLWEWYRARTWADNSANIALRYTLAVSSTTTFRNFEKSLLNLHLAFPEGPHLIYASFDDGLQIWALSGQDIYSAWVPISRQEITARVTLFARQCAQWQSVIPDIQAQGHQLYEQLLDPVITQLLSSAGSIVLELDDILINLPFEAIITPDGIYLAERYAITYSPGLWAEVALRRVGGVDKQSLTVLVNASESEGDVPLAGYQSEANAILRSFPNSKVIDASTEPWSSVLRRLATAKLAHFVAHGEMDGTGAALVLSNHPRRVIRAGDFDPQYLRQLQLVVLAACATQVGREDGFLDIDNLAHPFLSAGVPNVVASRWNVDSASTSELMQLFYKLLQQGKTAPEALLEARRHLISNKSHPFFWAGFSLIGRRD